jgi:ankyrin repeat protein
MVEVAKALWELGTTDLERRDKDGATAFYCACAHGQLEVVEWLYSDLGAVATVGTQEGTSSAATASPYSAAEFHGARDVIAFLEQNGIDGTPLPGSDEDEDEEEAGGGAASQQAKPKSSAPPPMKGAFSVGNNTAPPR